MGLIGRDRELARLRALLGSQRLVSVHGPAGVGKSRLAREAVGESGVFCSLAHASDSASVERAIATALAVEPTVSTGKNWLQRVLSHARGPFVLDQADAVLDVLRQQLPAWLQGSSSGPFVVTALSPLGLPDQAELKLKALSATHATQLYVEAVRQLGQRTDPAHAARIVQRLEYLPQAIVSFATLGALLGDSASLSRLEQWDGAGSTLERAMHSAVTTLSERDRETLGWLAAFVTGAGAGALEQLLGVELRRVEPLLKSSLVRLEPSPDATPRVVVYRSARRIVYHDDHQRRQAEQAHARAVLGSVESVSPHTAAGRRSMAVERSELSAIVERFAEREPELSARAALAQVSLAREDPTAGELAGVLSQLRDRFSHGSPYRARLDLSLAMLARRLGKPDEARRLAAGVLEQAGELRFDALIELAHVDRMQSRSEAALRGYEEAFETARRAGHASWQAAALGELGRMLQSSGQFREARERHVQAIALCRTHGLSQREALERSLHARATHRMGALAEAIPLHEQALALHRQHGEERLAAAELGHLGFCHHELDAGQQAESYFRESIAGLGKVGDLALEAIERILLARLLADHSRFAEARLELATAASISSELHMPRIEATHWLVAGLVELGDGNSSLACEALSRAQQHGALVEVGFEALLPAYMAVAQAAAGAPLSLDTTRGAQERIRELQHPGLSLAWELLMAAAQREPLPSIEPALEAACSDIRRATSLADRVGRVSAVLVAQDGRDVVLPDAKRVELSRRGAPRRLLLALVRARLDSPGQILPAGALIAVGWPGEKMRPAAANKRLRTAIWTLRKAGLDQLILTRDDGYLLDPLVAFSWR